MVSKDEFDMENKLGLDEGESRRSLYMDPGPAQSFLASCATIKKIKLIQIWNTSLEIVSNVKDYIHQKKKRIRKKSLGISKTTQATCKARTE